MFQTSTFARVPTLSSVVGAVGLSWWPVAQALPPAGGQKPILDRRSLGLGGDPHCGGGKWCLGVKLGGTGGVFPRGGQVGRWSGWPQPPGALWGRRAAGGQDVVFVICDNGFPEEP